uniref:Nephrocystin 4 n=1 Tax=Callorhinchus milii TaxID=7868 RepID=A0A4W3GL56_CALMI
FKNLTKVSLSSICSQLSFFSVQTLVEGMVDVNYQLRLNLFDTSYSHFFGRTLKSSARPLKSAPGQPAKVLFNEAVYLQTFLNYTHIVIIVEVVAFVKKRDGTQNVLSCGFGILPLNSRQQPTSDTTQPQVKRLNLYHGTPRALLHPELKDPIEKNRLMTLIEGSHILYLLRTHPALEKVMHLVPENMLISGVETIPGIVQPYGGTNDALKKPRILKSTIFHLDELSIQLYPTLEKFEEELVELLNADRLNKVWHGTDGNTIIIQERRLQVGVHNGWCFVQKPQVTVVIPSITMRGKSGSLRRSFSHRSLSGENESLILRSRIQLTEMVHHPAFAVVFQLEYVFSVPTITDGKANTATSFSETAYMHTIRWAVWNPPLKAATSTVTLPLHGGSLANPNNLLVYKVPSTAMSSLEVRSAQFWHILQNGTSYQQLLRFVFRIHANSTLRRVILCNCFVNDLSQICQRDAKVFFSHSTVASFLLLQLSLSQLALSSRYLSISHSDRITLQEHFSSQLSPFSMTSVQYTDCHHFHSRSVTSRAALAQMRTVGFPEILDDNKELAEVLDPQDAANLNLQKEEADYLQCNEIILQFLAFTRIPQDSLWPRLIYFSFQFYRFPPVITRQLQLVKAGSVEASGNMPLILIPVNKDGSINTASPGLELKYMVEPSFLKQGEQRWFIRYLAMQTLQIDVWDAESLLLMGSAAVELKHLLRQTRSAVQVTHELEVITTEFSQDAPMPSGDLTRHGAVKPFGVTTLTKGRLHMRLGNIGERHVSEQRKSSHSLPSSHSRVISSHEGPSGFPGGSLSNQNVKVLKGEAQRLSDLDSELASLLVTRLKESSISVQQGRNEMDAVRQRKLERMLAVRQFESSNSASSSRSHILGRREERIQHTRDLQIIEAYREQTKTASIVNMLHQAITTQYTMYATLGTAEFFEFSLKNPHNVQHTITIECEHPELSIIINSREWRHFKNLTNTLTPLEEDMFLVQGGIIFPQVYLRPKETVHIPFKFQTFSADHYVPPQVVAVKVHFKTEDGKPIAILQVNVESQPYVIDQTFRFYHPEFTFLKKSIRLPPWHTMPGTHVQTQTDELQINVRCSDSNIICETKKMDRNEPQDVFLKVSCGPSPQINKFFIMVYMDLWLATPIQIWQFYIHSLNRVDVSCVMGQLSQLSLVLRGTQAVRTVAAYTSHPHELQVTPSGAFVLPPHSVKDLHLTLRPQRDGNRCIYLNVVDIEYRQLVASWLMYVACGQPFISKAFEVTIPVREGKGSTKRISYTNLYPTKRVFFLRTNRADLLRYKEDYFEVGGGETYSIGLRFAPGQAPGVEEILIFINDQEEKNEATFCVKVTYQ